MRFFLIPLFVATTVCGHNVDELVRTALKQHHGLKAIEHKIAMLEQRSAIVSSLPNPELMLGVNDIQLDHPSRRDIEPMQFESIVLKQPLPSYNERELSGAIVDSDKKVMFHTLQEAKAQLAAAVKKEVYEIWRVQSLLQINDEALELTRQNIALNEAYTASSPKHHMGLMAAELAASELAVEQNRLEQLLKTHYARLGYLVNSGIDEVEIMLKMDANVPDGLNRPEENNLLKASEARVEREKRQEMLASAKHFPKTSLQAGYYHRAGFEDYLSFQVGIILPIYGRESLEEERARMETLARKEELADSQNEIRQRLSIMWLKLEEAYRSYWIIDQQSLPQLEHMTDINRASIRSGADLFDYIKLMQQKLALDSKKIEAITRYHRTKAEIAALQGAVE